MYLQYHCPRCNTTAERLIDYDKWDPAMLETDEERRNAGEGQPATRITVVEIAEFSRRLQRITHRDFEALRCE